jgi:hypothetical protein
LKNVFVDYVSEYVQLENSNLLRVIRLHRHSPAA